MSATCEHGMNRFLNIGSKGEDDVSVFIAYSEVLNVYFYFVWVMMTDDALGVGAGRESCDC